MFNINPATIHKTIFDKIPVRGQFQFVLGPAGIFVKTSPTRYAIPAMTGKFRTKFQIIRGLNSTNTGKVKYFTGAQIAVNRRAPVVELNPSVVMTEANHGADGC